MPNYIRNLSKLVRGIKSPYYEEAMPKGPIQGFYRMLKNEPGTKSIYNPEGYTIKLPSNQIVRFDKKFKFASGVDGNAVADYYAKKYGWNNDIQDVVKHFVVPTEERFDFDPAKLDLIEHLYRDNIKNPNQKTVQDLYKVAYAAGLSENQLTKLLDTYAKNYYIDVVFPAFENMPEELLHQQRGIAKMVYDKDPDYYPVQPVWKNTWDRIDNTGEFPYALRGLTLYPDNTNYDIKNVFDAYKIKIPTIDVPKIDNILKRK